MKVYRVTLDDKPFQLVFAQSDEDFFEKIDGWDILRHHMTSELREYIRKARRQHKGSALGKERMRRSVLRERRLVRNGQRITWKMEEATDQDMKTLENLGIFETCRHLIIR